MHNWLQNVIMDIWRDHQRTAQTIELRAWRAAMDDADREHKQARQLLTDNGTTFDDQGLFNSILQAKLKQYGLGRGKPAKCGKVEQSSINDNTINLNVQKFRISKPSKENALLIRSLWEWKHLGPTGEKVYPVLNDAPQLIVSLAEKTGLNRDTVSAALQALERAGLAQRAGKRGWLKGAASLLEAAETLGVSKRIAARKAKKEAEQEAWRTWYANGGLPDPDEAEADDDAPGLPGDLLYPDLFTMQDSEARQ